MGLFKNMKDLGELTKTAKEMQRKQQADAGYKPGFRGMVEQMGDMVGEANEQLKQLAGQDADHNRLLAEGIPGEGVIVAMGTPERGAAVFNLDIDLEIHVPGRDPYRVAQMYMVPVSAPIGPGARLPVRVDANDPAKVAIDWDSVGTGPARGEIRPAADAAAAPPAGDDDSIAQLERLSKLRESGALTDAEFAAQKAKILGT